MYLGLQPKCRIGGFNCNDCRNNLCCYQSRFSHGHIHIGDTADKYTLANSAATISQIALCKVSPALEGSFFQGEALGASPIKRCSICKSQISGCRLCTADQALLSAKADEEYKVMGDHCQFNQDKGVLVAKYLLCRDPAILKDNGSEALGCQNPRR